MNNEMATSPRPSPPEVERGRVIRRALRMRGTTISRLAASCCCGRSHVSQVLNGRRPGGHTRRKLRGLLTLEEQWELGWEREI